MEAWDLMFGQADQTLVVDVYREGLSAVRKDTLIWDLETGKTIPLPADSDPRITAYHSPIAVSYDRDRPELVVYNTADGSVRTSLTLESDFYVSDYTWAAESNMVAATIGAWDFDGTAVEVWNLDEGQDARVIDRYGGYEDVAWQSNDTLLVEAPLHLRACRAFAAKNKVQARAGLQPLCRLRFLQPGASGHFWRVYRAGISALLI
jgi:hypothetical protein